MASSSEVVESAVIAEAIPAKVPLRSLIAAMIAAMFVGIAVIGGAIFYLVHSGRLPVQKGIGAARAAAPASAPAAHAMVLEPMVANLSGTGTAAYLKMSLTLRIADDPEKKSSPAKDEKPAKGMSEAEAAVRDTVLMVVGRQTAEGLLASDGKERLKGELKASLAEHNPEQKVLDLYFIDFLVQQ